MASDEPSMPPIAAPGGKKNSRSPVASPWGRERTARALLAIEEHFGAEGERWALWLPVALALGIGAYFAWPHEPWPGLGAALAGAGLALAWSGRRVPWAALAGIALVAAGCGFALAAWRASALAAPALERRLGAAEVSGRIVQIEPGDRRWRLTLDRLEIPALAAAATPARVRVSLTPPGMELAPGDRVALKASLMPPPPPSAPGAYDFARAAWFRELGAVGYARGELRKLDGGGGQESWTDSYRVWLAGVRQQLTRRILDALPGAGGAVAAALMTGERAAIPEAVEDAFRDSGLSHLLSISGLHLALVAGVLFAAVRGGLAAVEPVALRHPIKKWAAVAALAGAFAYLQLSGSAVPTQRSFVMAAFVLVAILVDRQALSMRTVAWAALAVLLLAPESLLDAGFQMSFAAVVALIAAFEVMEARFAAWRAKAGPLRRAGVYVGLTAMTTLVAGLATAPFAAYHFNRFVDFALVANLAAVPLTSLWVMPCAVAAFVLMPFGLDGLALKPMGWGVDGVIWVAETVAAWPGAVVLVPAMPAWGIVLITIGGLWLCLWRQNWRRLGIAAILLGAVSPWFGSVPHLLIDRQGQTFAARGERGLYARGSDELAIETWLRRSAEAERLPWPRNGSGRDGRLRCDGGGCVYRAEGLVVALPARAETLETDCRGADVVIASFPIRQRCPGARVVIDRFDLWRHGAHALWLDGGRVRVERVNDTRGNRPWVLPRPRPPRSAAGVPLNSGGTDPLSGPES